MGIRVESIELASLGKPEVIVTKILQEWIQGSDVALTWHALVKTLRKCELYPLAYNIEAIKLPDTVRETLV